MLQQADQARTEAVDLAAVVHAAKHQEELVAAQARDQVAIAGAVAQACCYLLQHGVTGGMAKGVVDRLEVVQVQQQQGQWRRITAAQQGLLEVPGKLVAVGQPGQRVVQRQVLDARMSIDFVGDVAGGAAKADGLAVVPDGAGRNPAVAVLAILVAVGAAQVGQLLRVGRGQGIQPRRERCGIAGQQLIERVAEPVVHRVAGDIDEALRKVGQALLPIGFPDPVGGRLGHRAKTLLAGLQGLVALLQMGEREVDRPRTAQGMAKQVQHDQAEYQQGTRQRRQHRTQQLVPWQRAAPGQVVAGIAEVDAQVAVLTHIIVFHMHAGQAGTAAQLCQLFLGELVDEQHHRCLAHLAIGDIPVRAHRRGTEHCRPAVEQDETGDLFTWDGRRPGLVDDGLQRCINIGIGRRLGRLAFEQTVGGASVLHHEHPFIAAGAVQRLAHVLFFVGPFPVGLARQVFEGSIPHGVAGQELARGEQPLLQRLGCLRGTALALLMVKSTRDIEQGADDDQAGQAENCAEAGNQATHLEARCGAGGWKVGGPGHARAAPSGSLPPVSQEGGSIRIGQPERRSVSVSKIDLVASGMLGGVQRLVRLFEPVFG
ncbi:hypothetical protein D3C81_1047080 [compost metagenome]